VRGRSLRAPSVSALLAGSAGETGAAGVGGGGAPRVRRSRSVTLAQRERPGSSLSEVRVQGAGRVPYPVNRVR
jgi:hypothetical protein